MSYDTMIRQLGFEPTGQPVKADALKNLTAQQRAPAKAGGKRQSAKKQRQPCPWAPACTRAARRPRRRQRHQGRQDRALGTQSLPHRVRPRPRRHPAAVGEAGSRPR